MNSPASRIFGKVFVGSLVSSAMLTESSKPTIAKKASVVAAITGQMNMASLPALNWNARETSPWPAPIAQSPMKMTIKSPVSSTSVSTTLAFTLSPTPRKLTIATSAMKASPMTVMPIPPARLSPNTCAVLAAKAREAVEAEVMPEHITAKATMKVTKWMPKARWV
jgi:hypothetical protein